MSTLSARQVAALALWKGLSDEDAAIATAIGWGPRVESSGDTDAEGDTDTSAMSVGIWQIRTLDARIATAYQNGEIAQNTRAAFVRQLKNPAYNATWMERISSGGRSWTPWTGYTSGKYKQFLDEGRAAVRAVRAGKKTPKEYAEELAKGSGIAVKDDESLGDKLNPLDDISDAAGDAIAALTGWLGPGIARAGLVLGGTLLVVIMLITFLAPALGRVAAAVT